MTRIDPEALALAVSGINLRPGTLADQLDPHGNVVFFLRHFG